MANDSEETIVLVEDANGRITHIHGRTTPAHAPATAPDNPLYKKLYDNLHKKLNGFTIVVKAAPGRGMDNTIQIEISGKGYGKMSGIFIPYFHYDTITHKLTERRKGLRDVDRQALEKSLEEVFGKHKGGRRRTYRKRKHNKRKTRR